MPAFSASSETIWTVAGTGALADTGDGGHARGAAINQPRAVSATADGRFAWAEPYSHRVRIVDQHGVIRTLAGTGEAGFSGDGGPATAAKLNFVHTAEPTADGGFLLTDSWNNRIRKVSAAGVISTVAGNGEKGFGGDGGPATNALLNHPRSVVALPDGGFLIPDTTNHRVRRVSANGVITTVAGTGLEGYGGDGGPATAARLWFPFAVAPTADGGFLIADAGNQRIREVTAAGIITTVAGSGAAGFSGDGGPATAAQLRDPHNVVELGNGAFLIADSSNNRVRRVDPDGVITTLAGDGIRGATGDGGPASAARLSAPKGMAVTATGDLLIADEQNNRIRFVGTVVAPANTIAPAISGAAQPGQELTASAGGWSGTGPLISFQWQRCDYACADIPGAVSETYTAGDADRGDALRVVVTASNSAGTAVAVSRRTAAVGTARSGQPSPQAPSPAGEAPRPGGGPPATPPPQQANWRILVSAGRQQAGEFTVRSGTARLADAVAAYGRPSCRVSAPGRVAAVWSGRGIRIDGVALRSPPRGTSLCSATALVRVAEIRLTDRRWTTGLNLHVGDSTRRLKSLYPRSALVRSPRTEYYLVWRHERCVSRCTAQAKRRGVNVPRLSAEIVNGRVVAFRLPVSAARP